MPMLVGRGRLHPTEFGIKLRPRRIGLYKVNVGDSPGLLTYEVGIRYILGDLVEPGGRCGGEEAAAYDGRGHDSCSELTDPF